MVAQAGWGTHMGQVLLKFIHLLQSGILRLRVFQQTTHVKHVIQVGLDLHRQLVTLCVFTFLTRRQNEPALENLYTHRTNSPSLRMFI